jgi:hypothetical protein
VGACRCVPCQKQDNDGDVVQIADAAHRDVHAQTRLNLSRIVKYNALAYYLHAITKTLDHNLALQTLTTGHSRESEIVEHHKFYFMKK